MKRFIFPLSLLIGSLLFTGCVSKKQFVGLESDYKKLQTEHSGLKQSYQDAQVQLAECRTSGKSLEDRLAEARRNNQEIRSSYAALQGSLDKSLQQNSQGNINISKLVDEINASNRFIKQLVETKSKSDSLNMVLSNNLTRSLSRDELKEVDVQVLKGVVYISLADNMLYKSGGYEVNERAGETLSKIAKIIMDYKDYDVLVEGNTDTDPISRPNIRNNWDLSTLRASSVVQVLQNTYGVDPKRLTAAGRGQYNPIADNSTALGRQRNRRTQIIITPKLDQFMDLIDKAPESSDKK
jgi:chemotaxis protein MotB